MSVIFGENDSQIKESEINPKELNSQNVPLLEVAINVDPDPAKGGADINTIEDVVAPFIGTGKAPMSKLSDRELEVCNMIKQGFSSKQIADMLHTSTQTVLKQRKMIRRKLRISGKKINLSSYLKSVK